MSAAHAIGAEVFVNFCGDGKHDMEGKNFTKMCRDIGLLDKKFTVTDTDLIFAKICEKGARRIDWNQCHRGLELAADKKGISIDEVMAMLAHTGGPLLAGTHADKVRFHDDKSTYTGAHANGGPESVPKGAGYVPAGGFVVAKDTMLATPKDDHQLPRGRRDASPQPTRTPSPMPRVCAPAERRNPEDVFLSFCVGKEDMDGKSFVKLCKDTGLLDKKFTTTDADLAFAKVCEKGARRIFFEHFERAMEIVAVKKGTTASAVMEKVASGGGPVLTGTTADAVRFHDDKSTYTGTHINGGPESVAVGAGSATQLASLGMKSGVTR